MSALIATGLSAAGAQAAVTLPAAITPVPCSVSALITAISGASSGDVLLLAPNCTYNLTSAISAPDGSVGLPVITNEALTLVGGPNTIIQRGSGTFRIFEVLANSASNASLTLRGITVSNGRAIGLSVIKNEGGCILANTSGPNTRSTVVLEDSTVSGCFATFSGGGIYLNSRSHAYIDDSDVSSNTAIINGGGIYVDDEASISHSSLTHNAAVLGGAVFVDSGAEAKITGSSLVHNVAGSGGAVFVDSNGYLRLDKSSLRDNSVTGSGGAVNSRGDAKMLTDTMTDNHAIIRGGAIFNDGDMYLGVALMTKNGAGTGGGIYNDNGADLHIAASRLEQNTAVTYGGGIANYGDIFIQNSYVLQNSASLGGGIANYGNVIPLMTSILNNVPNNCWPGGSVPTC